MDYRVVCVDPEGSPNRTTQEFHSEKSAHDNYYAAVARMCAGRKWRRNQAGFTVRLQAQSGIDGTWKTLERFTG